MYTYMEIKDGNECFNGNIANVEWQIPGSSVRHLNLYEYDGCNRLVSVHHCTGDNQEQDGKYDMAISSFDLNGNAGRLKRTGKRNDGSYGLVDDLTMSYVGNQLVSVSDAASSVSYEGTNDFADGANSAVEYTYDGTGSMLSDSNKGISDIEYDMSGFIRRVTFSNGNMVEYDYSPSGVKQCVTHMTAVQTPFIGFAGNTAEESVISYSDVTEYVGEFVFCNGDIDKVIFDNGYIDIGTSGTPSFYFFTTDQQGSVRAVFDLDGTVKQTITYDALGNVIPDLSSNLGFQPYSYNGKEIDRVHGINWYDYGFRHYDAALSRWFSVDRLSEKYYSSSPYLYCMANAPSGIDVMGLDYWSTNNATTIERFMKSLSNSDVDYEIYKDFEVHMTDPEFLSHLFYDDERQEYKFIYAELVPAINGGYAGHNVNVRTIPVIANLTKAATLLTSYSIGHGAKTELSNYAIRNANNMSYRQFKNLTNEQKFVKTAKVVGNHGAKYINTLKMASNGLGYASMLISAADLCNHIRNGEENPYCYIKSIADIAFTYVSMTSPWGFVIGSSYFLVMMALESKGKININN